MFVPIMMIATSIFLRVAFFGTHGIVRALLYCLFTYKITYEAKLAGACRTAGPNAKFV